MTARVTSHEVAARAGVSQSTVSLVLSGKARGRVSPALQRRVTDAAQALRYRPHESARTLRSGRARAIGLLVPDVTNPFLGRVLRGAQQAAREDRYTVALVEPGRERDWQLESMQTLRAGAVDGLVLFVVEPPPGPERDLLGPLVTVDAERAGVPAVVLDVAGGADAALQHLAGLGHTRIGHLAADIPSGTFRVRRDRWAHALERLGVPPGERREERAEFALSPAREAGRALLERTPRPTAVFCDDDLLAAALSVAAAELGLRVPADLSIVGFAGTFLSEIPTPAITTVAAPAEEMGAAAIRTLLAAIDGRPVPERTVLPVELVVRGSTGPPS
jgi:LacI family repressor for deo operon, udp, cdd, tsx, nupC, and nupG